MSDFTPRQQALKERFTKERGYWSPIWEDLLRSDEDFFEAYLNFSAVPWKNGPLSPKEKELIYVAIDAATTHLYEPGLRIHIRNALKYGATKEEILEVFQLVSVLGIHTCTLGVPVLVDELHQVGQTIADSNLTERQQQLKERFQQERGYWAPLWDELLQLDPDFFEAYLNFSAVPWNKGSLSPKMRELIYIAIDASTTHLYEPGLRVHIRNALKYGATKEEILEVFQLTSVLGIHTCTMGMPVLMEELRAAQGD